MTKRIWISKQLFRYFQTFLSDIWHISRKADWSFRTDIRSGWVQLFYLFVYSSKEIKLQLCYFAFILWFIVALNRSVTVYVTLETYFAQSSTASLLYTLHCVYKHMQSWWQECWPCVIEVSVRWMRKIIKGLQVLRHAE